MVEVTPPIVPVPIGAKSPAALICTPLEVPPAVNFTGSSLLPLTVSTWNLGPVPVVPAASVKRKLMAAPCAPGPLNTGVCPAMFSDRLPAGSLIASKVLAPPPAAGVHKLVAEHGSIYDRA